MSYFAQFGIVKSGHNYIFTVDRELRQEALLLTTKAIVSNGLSDRPFGLEFWKGIYDEYWALMASDSTDDGDISDHVKDKDQYMAKVRKTLKSLLLSIEANYPDTYLQVQRQWGFQRENY